MKSKNKKTRKSSSKVLENNVVNSFLKVKKDVIKMEAELSALKQNYQRLYKLFELNILNNKEPKVVVKTKNVSTTKKVKLVASKNGKKVHSDNCPFAKNIKKQITFKSKYDALKQGYGLCACLK